MTSSTAFLCLCLLVAPGSREGGASAVREGGEPHLEASTQVWGDADGDGLADLYLLRPAGDDRLFRNAGDGRFEDVTAVSGLAGNAASRSAAWRDFDRDEHLDLLVVTREGGLRVYRGEGGGSFLPATEELGLAGASDVGAARWSDYDGDGWVDLVVDGRDGTPAFFHSLGGRAFERVSLGLAEAIGQVAPAGTLDGIRTVDGRTAGGKAGPARARPADRAGTPPRSPEEPSPEGDGSSRWGGIRAPLDPAGGTEGSPASAPTISSSGGSFAAARASDIWVDEDGDTMTGTLTLSPADDRALDVASGSIYKGGALFLHTKGGGLNTALGEGALEGVTGGYGNTASGYRALAANTGGLSNTANGAFALNSNTTGLNNTASGTRALQSNTSGYDNTACGAYALQSNTSVRNTATGAYALQANTSGYDNTAAGWRALRSNTTGDLNTAVGMWALSSNTTGSQNTAVGRGALRLQTTGGGNTAIGIGALSYNTTGSFNTANGSQALINSTTGYHNTACGWSALSSNLAGEENTAHGSMALSRNNGGYENTASGFRASYANTTGYRNASFGAFALTSNTTGYYNTAVGKDALQENTTASDNTAVGHRALENNTTGANNIALGKRAGVWLTTGDDNIHIGHTGSAGEAATIRVGASQTRAFVAGVRGVTTGNANAIPVLVDSAGQLGTISSSARFKEDVQDMGGRTAALLDLRPVVFRYRPEVQAGERPLEYGLIAEEVAEVFPELVVYDEQGRPFTVKYHLLSAMLLNELQKLDERHRRALEEVRARLARVEGWPAPAPVESGS